MKKPDHKQVKYDLIMAASLLLICAVTSLIVLLVMRGFNLT